MAPRLIVPKEEAEARAEDDGKRVLAEVMQAHAQALSDALRPVLIEVLIRLDMLARLASNQRPKSEIAKQLNDKDREARKAAAQAELARIEAEAEAEQAAQVEVEDEDASEAFAVAEARLADGDV